MLFRTDMADERRDIFRKINKIEEINGIECESEDVNSNLHITRVKILNENGSKALNKAKGNYITIDLKKINNLSEKNEDTVINTISKELKNLIEKHISKEDEILVVGLGNENLVADALGSKVINSIEVTRHIKKYFPQYLKEGEREVSAISPGVMGVTGIETIEVVKGVVDNINPKLLIVIDSLASRSIKRIGKSIQISDTGIAPRSGESGNKQESLTYETLNIPVIAIGIPTCVETAVIVNDSLDLFIGKLQDEAKSNEYLNNLKEKDNYEEIKNILIPENYNLIVTPKEIDDLIENISGIIADRNQYFTCK